MRAPNQWFEKYPIQFGIAAFLIGATVVVGAIGVVVYKSTHNIHAIKVEP